MFDASRGGKKAIRDGNWAGISMRKRGSGGEDLCAVQEDDCAQSQCIQVWVIPGKSLNPSRLSSPLLG